MFNSTVNAAHFTSGTASVPASTTTTTASLPIAPHPSMSAFPEPIPHFIGRDREIQTIERLIQQGVNVIELTDPTNKIGMGKTALGIQAVHQLKSHYSNCQLYANLHGQDAFPAQARDVLQEWLVLEFNLDPRQLPQRVSELQTLYQTQLNDKRAIVLLDNVTNLKQIQPLITFAKTQSADRYVVLITSRKPVLPVDQGKTLFVDELSASSSIDLLTSSIQPERPIDPSADEALLRTIEHPSHRALEQLIKLAEGSPFILHLMGRLLGSIDPAQADATNADALMLNIEKMKRQYQTKMPETQAQTMACFNAIYQTLEVPDRDLLSRLSVLYGAQFNAPLAAHLSGEDHLDQIEIRLAALYQKGWLTTMPNVIHGSRSPEYMMRKVTSEARRTLVSWALAWQDQDRHEIDRRMTESEAA
jgi:hypothetical protein